jgi:hypothetical protein
MERIKQDVLPKTKALRGSYPVPEKNPEQLAAPHGVCPDFKKSSVSTFALERRSSAIDILVTGTALP